jgi:Uma2 family endonuclease
MAGRAAEDRTYVVEDLYELPDDGYRYELLAGSLLREPRPGTLHGLVVTSVTVALAEWARAGDTGVVLTGDSGFILERGPDTVRGPDVAWISRARFEAVGPVRAAFPGAPDLAVEVLSPTDRRGDVHAKVADYLAAGTRLVWLVDPERRRVISYERLLAPRVFGSSELLCDQELLPEFGVRVGELFPD